MQKTTKMLAVAFAVMTTLALCLTGCSGAPAAVTTAAAQASSAPAAETATAETTASAQASAPAQQLEPYQIDYFMLCNGAYDKMADVDAAMSKIMTEKFNATLKTTMVGWSDWAAKVTTRIAAGDKIDVCFTADWYGYMRDVNAGLFSPLNDLLTKNAPETVASLGDVYVKGSQIAGQNYGVPTNKELLIPNGIIFNKDLVDKYGFDITKVTKEEDLEPMLAKIKASEPDVLPLLFNGDFGVLPLFGPASDFGDAALPVDGSVTKVEWTFDNAMMKTHLDTMRKWYQAGYIHPDAALDTFNFGERETAEGWFCAFERLKGNNIKSAELGAASRDGKLKLVEQQVGPKCIYSSDCGGSMLAIPVTSKDLDRAMMFINLLHQDKTALNTLAWGIEGVNYKKVSDNVVQVIPDNGYTNQVLLWTLGSVFNQFTADTEDPNKPTLLKEYAKEGAGSFMLGFRYNPTNIANEKAAYDNISAKYRRALLVGAVDPTTTIAKYKQEAQAAGLDKCLADVQSQVDKFLAAK